MAKVPVEVKKATPAPTPDPWQSFRSEIDRLFDRFSGSFGLPTFRRWFNVEPVFSADSVFGATMPAVDVTEDDKAYKLTAELPGMEQKNIEVTVTADMLTLKGEKLTEKEEKDKNRYMSERSYGAFERSFSIPDSVDRDKIVSDLAKGVLTITLPKKPAAQQPVKKIEVKAAV